MYNPTSGACAETTGFLFSHPCPNLPIHACATCGKRVCDDHLHRLPTGGICTSCAKQQRGTGGAMGGAGYYGSPYFYLDSDYDDWGGGGAGSFGGGGDGTIDGDDFTEADGQSVQGDDGGGFEQDMGAS